MTDLLLDVGQVVAGREHEADVCPPEGVRSDVRQDRRLPHFRAPLVGPLDDGVQDAHTDVVLVSPPARPGRERGRDHVGLVVRGAVGLQLLEQAQMSIARTPASVFDSRT